MSPFDWECDECERKLALGVDRVETNFHIELVGSKTTRQTTTKSTLCRTCYEALSHRQLMDHILPASPLKFLP